MTTTVVLAVGLSACATDGIGPVKSSSKAPAPVEVAAMPSPHGAPDPMAVDPLFAAPPPSGSAAGATSGSERVPLGQLSGASPPASQRVPLGALSKPQNDAKPPKATSAPLLIAPKAGDKAATAMSAPPPAPVYTPPASSPPTSKLPPVKSELMAAPAATPAPPKAEPAKTTTVAAAGKKKNLLDYILPSKGKGETAKPSSEASAQDGKPSSVASATTGSEAAKQKLKIPERKNSPGSMTPPIDDEDTVVISSATPVPQQDTREFIPASLSDRVSSEPIGTSMIDRPMTAAEKNVAQRFEVLKTLLDEGLITPEEYNRHRAANVGALLPYTHDPASAGLERPSAGAEAIVARLQALRRALELHAITTEQHASERSMILAALLPANPEERTLPVQPPADVIQGAAIVSRLQTLKNRGLISSDEFEGERKSIDQFLRTGTFKGPSAVADKGNGAKGSAGAMGTAKDAKDAKDTKTGKKETAAEASPPDASETSDTAEVTGSVLHLASFRTKEGAEKAWQEILAPNKSILGRYRPVIRKVDLGAGKGVFFRLMVGPFTSVAEAESTCIRLKANNQFCRASSSASGS